jgi:hypothetical protein
MSDGLAFPPRAVRTLRGFDEVQPSARDTERHIKGSPMHKLIRLLPALVLFALAFIAPGEARADAVAITGGNYQLSNPFTIPRFVSYSFDVSGDNFRARTNQADGPALSAGSNCAAPCAAGSTFSLNATNNFSTGLPTSTLTLGGQTRTGFLGLSLNLNSGAVTIPLDAPTDPNQTFTLTTTFTMTGTVNFSEYDLQNNVLTGFNYNSAVFGSGIVDITLFFSPTTHDFVIRSINYQFQPAAATPEPATLILLGTGLAGAAAHRKRRRVSR